jgi:hypothetical protein
MTQMLVQMEAIGKYFLLNFHCKHHNCKQFAIYKLAARGDAICLLVLLRIMVLLHLYSNITVVTIGLLLLLCVGGGGNNCIVKRQHHRLTFFNSNTNHCFVYLCTGTLYPVVDLALIYRGVDSA